MNNLARSNQVLICLIQALTGALSPNFRRVSFNIKNETSVELLFELYQNSEEDFDEIEDIIFELEALIVGEFDVEFAVSHGELRELPTASRIVLSMRGEGTR